MAPESEPPTYHRGYPARAARLRKSQRAWSVGCAAPFVLLSLVATAFFGLAVHQSRARWDVVLLTVSAALALVMVRGLYRSVRSSATVRIVPYFQTRIDLKQESWSTRGQALARNCEALDRAAQAKDLTLLSTFGFCDDEDGDELAWHRPREGNATIEGLRDEVKRSPGGFTDPDELLTDLEWLAAGLQHADGQDSTPFCLVLRGDDSVISPVEVDRRQGSFW